MSKTIRSTSRTHTERDSYEHQLLKVKKVITSNKADDFMRDFHITEYIPDTIFPNRDKETAKEYTRRNIENYTVVIFHIKELITVLADPLSGRPVTSEFNWVLNAIEHRVEIDDDLVNTMTIIQKGDLLQRLLEEAEIRLIMLQSIPIPVSLSLVSPTSESKEIMTNENNTTYNNHEAVDKAAASAAAAYKAVEERAAAYMLAYKQAEERAVANIAAYNEAEKMAEIYMSTFYKAVSGSVDETMTEQKATEKVAEADQTTQVPAQPKPVEKGTDWKKVGKYTAVTAATIGAVAGSYWLYKNKDSVFGSLSRAGDLASEQVVGG